MFVCQKLKLCWAILFCNTGTPLSEEDSDALHKLLQDTKVKLPSGQLTLERVVQLLRDKDHKELASNLRAELNKGLCSV